MFQLLRTLPLAFYLSFLRQASCKFVSFSGIWRFHQSCLCQDDSDIITHVHCAQGRNEVRWRPGQEGSLAPPCSNLRSFGSKCAALKKVLATLLGFFGAPRSDSAPMKLFAPLVMPLAVQYLVEPLLSNLRRGQGRIKGGQLPLALYFKGVSRDEMYLL